MADLKQIAETLVNLTVKEVSELATIMKDEYGIEPAAAAVAVAGLGPWAAAEQWEVNCRYWWTWRFKKQRRLLLNLSNVIISLIQRT